MHDLDELAAKYHAFEKVDISDFQRRARTLQSIWREEQGYPMGVHRGRKGERPLGSRLPMPWARETLANYLTETIRQVVRSEVLDRRKSLGKLYGQPRIFNDLLSSQPLCFNLFGELQQDLSLATSVFRSLSFGRVREVTGIEFEYSPGRGDPRYTGDRSAFDVYATTRTPEDGRGFVAIEMKYHENLRGVAAPHQPRYDEVAGTMGCFEGDHLRRLRSQPLQQIWRDHLLAGIHQHVDGFDDGFFAFLYPRDNPHCADAVRAYGECLSDADSFAPWTLEQVGAAIEQHTQAEWISLFADRYLNFDKLDDDEAQRG